MITSIFTHILLLFGTHLFSLELLSIQASEFGSYSINFTITCQEKERNALLKFKEGLKDPSGRLSSWVGNDCCAWFGVGCSRRTGHVTTLDLRNPYGGNLFGDLNASDLRAFQLASLRGKVNPSLLDLKYLSYLDLSLNNFEQTPIPNFFGSFTKLEYLNLSYASFAGLIPPHLGNLSNLRYLDLSTHNSEMIFQDIWIFDLNWISGLSLLKHLNLGVANLSSASTNWLQAVNMLSSLVELHLPYCNLHDLPTFLPVVNFSSIMVINLRNNNFNSPLPSWLLNISTLVELDLSHCGIKGSLDNVDAWENLCFLNSLALSSNEMSGEIVKLVESLSKCSNNSLEELDLSSNGFNGLIPQPLQNLNNMRYLSLSGNHFSGPFPVSLENLSSLEELYLFSNELNGTIPQRIGQLKHLTDLILHGNNWGGVVSRNHFVNLKSLRRFSLSSKVGEKSLAFHVGHDWVPPFSLAWILIDNCEMDIKFPAWIQTQKELVSIRLDQVGISDFVPDWFWELCPRLGALSLRNNKLRGKLPRLLKFAPGSFVGLSFNLFDGPLPHVSGVIGISFKNNLLSGPIPANFGLDMLDLFYLDLSENNLNGSIPSSLSKLSLINLSLGTNQLSGRIPKLKILWALNLSKNNLSGNIPSSLCSGSQQLSYLKLNDNNLYGRLSSLQNCTSLSKLNLANNHFSGGIPRWIGENLTSLSILNLQGNMFRGQIPRNLCFLSNLHVLDLGQNNLSGSIPPCLGNLTGLYHLENQSNASEAYHFIYEVYTFGRYWDDEQYSVKGHLLEFAQLLDYWDDMEFNVKGQRLQFTHFLDGLVNLIDLSSNNLEGDIPEEIVKLSALGTLNLSQNQLTGNIPKKIGALQLLETLDLSVNHLSGLIPESMSSMTSLSHLNLSYNDLSGPIPSANQFQTFNDPSIFEGNPRLCGSPLPTNCSTHINGISEGNAGKDRDEDGFEMLWFYIGVASGFVVGFWTVCGTLVIKRSWRHAYFQFVEETKDRIYIFVAVKAARLQKRVKGERS
ncbi:hypothetical protein SLE2022_046340 [Rubroshorea leprosula]